MPFYFQSDLPTYVDALVRERLDDVLGAPDGDWIITLTERPAISARDASIERPKGFKWAKRFSGAERDIDNIVQSIRRAITLAEMDLTTAMSELAKAGIAFTTETDSDGDAIYIIDRIRLTEEELVRLKNTGALTPAGIRRYLVDRAA